LGRALLYCLFTRMLIFCLLSSTQLPELLHPLQDGGKLSVPRTRKGKQAPTFYMRTTEKVANHLEEDLVGDQITIGRILSASSLLLTILFLKVQSFWSVNSEQCYTRKAWVHLSQVCIAETRQISKLSDALVLASGIRRPAFSNHARSTEQDQHQNLRSILQTHAKTHSPDWRGSGEVDSMGSMR
jgi:hypothetical protein